MLFFHNLEPQNAGLVDVKKDLNLEKIFFSNTFTHNQAEQIKKGVLCVQILFEIHPT